MAGPNWMFQLAAIDYWMIEAFAIKRFLLLVENFCLFKAQQTSTLNLIIDVYQLSSF